MECSLAVGERFFVTVEHISVTGERSFVAKERSFIAGEQRSDEEAALTFQKNAARQAK